MSWDSRAAYGRMMRNDEVAPGIKRKDWQWPEMWGEPYRFPPSPRPGGMWVEYLHFKHRSVVRVCDAPNATPDTINHDHDHDDDLYGRND